MAAILTGTYDPVQVVVTVGGVIVTGFSDGDSIIARRSEDSSFVRAGIDGAVGRARNASKLGEFEFRLLQTSDANDGLSALVAIDDMVNDGLITVPVSVLDGSGRSLAVGTQCWLKNVPEMTFGKEVGERVWIFSVADLKIFSGGNN